MKLLIIMATNYLNNSPRPKQTWHRVELMIGSSPVQILSAHQSRGRQTISGEDITFPRLGFPVGLQGWARDLK
jgi:hypothetical protein